MQRPAVRWVFFGLAVLFSGVLALLLYTFLRNDLPEPEGRIAFAAGGSIYVIDAGGSNLTRVVAGERKDGIWASAPAFSPDGRRIAFARDFDIWLLHTETGKFTQLDVTEYVPSPGASNWSVGVTNVSWSPDGEQLLFGTARVGGSGIGYFERVNVDGSDQVRLFEWSAGFILPWWLPEGRVGFAGNRGQVAILVPPAGIVSQRELFQDFDGELFSKFDISGVGWPAVIDADANGNWLVGGFINEEAIVFGEPDAMRQVAAGVSPALSPGGDWIAYFQGEGIRLVRTDGGDDHLLVDLGPLGGRDRHFAGQPDCFPDNLPGCSYRPPLLSWTSAGD